MSKKGVKKPRNPEVVALQATIRKEIQSLVYADKHYTATQPDAILRKQLATNTFLLEEKINAGSYSRLIKKDVSIISNTAWQTTNLKRSTIWCLSWHNKHYTTRQTKLNK